MDLTVRFWYKQGRFEEALRAADTLEKLRATKHVDKTRNLLRWFEAAMDQGKPREMVLFPTRTGFLFSASRTE